MIQAFCEIGSSYSKYVQLAFENTFGNNEDGAKLFSAFTGRQYQFGRDDYYEVMDILCYVDEYYQLAYFGAQSINSFNRYLIDLYGEKEVYHLMLFPETVEEVTNNTWEQLATEWELHIRNKYKDVVIP